MGCSFETPNKNINTMFSIFNDIENMELESFDTTDENAMKHYGFIAKLLINEKDEKKLANRLEDGDSSAYFNKMANILLSTPSLKGQLSVLAKEREVKSNADKIDLYVSFLNAINVGLNNRPLNLGIVNQIESQHLAFLDEDFAQALKEREAKKEAENTTVIPEKNAASVFAARPFEYPINYMDFRNDFKQGNEKFLSVYQAMVYAKYINTVGNKSDEKSEVLKEILETTDPAKLRTLWESYTISNPTILKRWQQGLKRLIVQLFERSFTENSMNKESLRQAIEFLKTTKPKVTSENSDAIGDYYAALLSFYKDTLVSNYVNKDRKISFSTGLTLDTIEANPQTVYVVSRSSALYKKMKENEGKGKKYDNVISIETEKNISDSEKVDVPPYYVGKIEKDDDVIMVYGSNQLGINGAGSALSAKQQGRIGEKERVVNRISDSGKAYGLNTVVRPHEPLNTGQIIANIKTLYETAKEHPDKTFAVAYTNVGTEKSLNGYTGNEMISMFLAAGPIPSNMKFSENWIDAGRFGIDAYKKDVNNIVEQLKGVKGDIVIDNDAFTSSVVQHKWAQTSSDNYEVSSDGDSRFSALNATFNQGTILFGHDVSGRTIESVYQHGVKQGDWVTDNNSKTGVPQNKDIIKGNTEDASYAEGYLPLWQEWAEQNPTLIDELRKKSNGKVLTDKFANTRVSQARALADILNSTETATKSIEKGAYNSYLHRQLSELAGATKLEAEDKAIKLLTALESTRSYKKVSNTITELKRKAFQYLRDNDSKFKYGVPSYLNDLLFFGNGFIRVGTDQNAASSKIEDFDVLSNVAYYMLAMRDEYSKGFDENELALFEEYTNWFKPKINSRTRAIIYVPNRGFFANEQKYTEAINKAVENAEMVLKNGGMILTLDYNSLSSKVGEVARKEDSNKIIWNKLLEKGFKPTNIKGYHLDIWSTKDTIAEDDEEARKAYDTQLEKIRKKTTELKTFEPSVVTTTLDNIIDNEIIVSNKMFSTIEDKITNGLVTFYKDDPLYSRILSIQDTIANNPDFQHRVRFMLDGVIYYANITYDDIIVDNESVSIKGNFGRTQINGYMNVDISFRNTLTSNPTDIIETHNPNILLGAEKASEYISDITETLVDFINEDITAEKDRLRERIASLEEELTKVLSEKLVNKFNDDVEGSEETDEAAIKEELGDLKKKLKKLNDGNYADFINDKTYTDEDGTEKPLGIESWVKEILSDRYEYYANMSDEDKKEEYAENVEFLKSLNDNYDLLSEERDPDNPDLPSPKEQFDNAVSIEAQNMIEREIKASQEIISYFDDLIPYVYKNLSSRINIKIDTYREAETSVTKVESEDNSFNATLADYYENDDAITPVTEEEFVFRDNYQAELLDIAKSVSFEVKRQLFENVYVRSDNATTSYYKVNSFGMLAHKNRDDVYNFLRERLSGLHTLAEMIQWIEDYVDDGHFEYAVLLEKLKSAPKNLQSKFFCCMFTQKANRQSHLNSKQLGSNNPNKIVDDIKDLRQSKMRQMTTLNLNTQNVLVEDTKLNLVGALREKREDRFNAVRALLTTTYKKFYRANGKYRDNLKRVGYTPETLKQNNIFTSVEPEDVAIVNEVIDNTRKVLQAIGISVTNQQLRTVITSREQYDELYSILTNSAHSGILSEKNFLNVKNKDLLYDNFKFGYNNIFEFLSPMYEEVPQKGTVHAAGKDFATYMYPSFASLLWDNLNDDSINPETGKRRNMEYIEQHYMQHPIFYKDDNLDEIIAYIKEHGYSDIDYSPLLRDLDKDSIRKKIIEDMYDEDYGGYVLHLEKQDRVVKTEDAIPLWYLNKQIHEKIRETLKTARDLPEFCPGYETEIWRNEWLKTIHLNYTNTYHKLKSEKWNKLQTVLLTMSNGKEYKDLKDPEFMQFLIDNYVTIARRTKNHFGAFYSPMVSDAETCRTEIFLNLHISNEDKKEAALSHKDALILAAAKKLENIVRGEIELRNQLLNKFIHRLEAYNAYNKYVEFLKQGDVVDRNVDTFKGYSEFIADFDITEKPLVYKKAANGLAIISLDGLVFNEDGTLNYKESEDALVARIKDFNGYTFNYVDYKPEKGALLDQCYDELESQFYKFLGSLDKNTTIPGKYGNYRVFNETKKKTENELIEEEQEKDTPEEEENSTQIEDSIESTEEFDNEEDLYSQEEEEEKTSVAQAKDSIISTINPSALWELKKFFINQAYANTQLQQLFNTSPSFYKGGNPVELQKRGKEHNTPMQRLDLTDFTRDYERVIYLKDLRIDSIDEALDEIIDGSPNLTDAEKANIKRAFKGMKIADGQAFRSPESYIKIQKGLGRWNDDMQAAYDRLCDPSKPVTFADIQMITMNPLKGFTFSMENVNLTPDYSIPMPVQHKDSEYTLLFGIAKARLKDNSVLQGLAEFMSRKDKDGDCLIDAAIFGTAVKVGGYGAIDLNKCSTAEDAKAVLERACFNGNGSFKSNIVHNIPWKDYGIVSETPEHFFEEEALFGTQIRRIMYGDLELDKVYDMPDELNGTVTKMTGQEIIDKYSHLIEANLKEAFDDLLDLFFTKDKGIEASAKLEKYLLREVTGNPLYPQDIAEYCKFDRRKTLPDGKNNPNYGKFTKLSNPKNYAKVQQLLLSLFKNRITKQRIAGGSCVQVSVAYDYNDLRLVTKDAIDANGKAIIDEKTGKPKKVVEYAECYLPAYLESIYSKFLRRDGTINLAKMEKHYKKKGDTKTFYALTNMIGYRIPTEGLSSTIKLKVKGFLTGYTGSSIILPKEIVTLSGSDFDIDKLYIHRYSFRNRNGYPELITKAETEDENRDVRNNELITMMMGIMTLPENNMLMIKPQGFENLKKSAMIANILANPKYNYSVKELRNMDSEELEKMASFEDDLSFLNPTTHVYFQQQNMIGKSLLGVWAVAKSAHCLFERSGLYLKEQYRFSYGENNFVKPDSITVVKDGKNVYVSTELGSYIGASADNAKDPVLAKLGITKDNINTVVYLARLGIDSTSIAIMLKNRFFNKSSYYKLLADAGYFENGGKTEDAEQLIVKAGIDDIDINGIVFNDELLQSINSKGDILDDETKVTVQMRDGSTDVLTKQQLAFLINKLFNKVITPAAEQLNQLTLSVRADSQNGAVSSNMAETYSRIQQMEASEMVLNNKDLTVFVNDPESKDKVPFFTTSFTGLNSAEDVDTKVAFVQKFMNYGVLAVRDLMRDKLPHFGATFRNAFSIGYHTRNGYISAENAKKLERALYYYHLGNLSFFGDEEVTDEKTGQKKLITKDSKIDYYRDNMINIYGQMLTKYPELNNNLFISLLSPDDELTERDKARGKIRTLRMPNSNLFPNDTKADIQNSFLQLLSSNNKDIVKFAWDLVRYGFYRYGFGFLPDGYMHLIPNEVFDSLEGYDEMLNKLLEVDEAGALKNGLFIEDFILNNMSMIKSLNSMPWKTYIELQKEKKPNEMLDMLIKTYGEVPPYMCFTSWDSDNREVVYTLMKFNPYNLTYYPVKKNKEDSSAKENKYFVKYRYYKQQPMIDYSIDVNSMDSLTENYEKAKNTADIYEASNFMTTIINGLKPEEIEELDENQGKLYNDLVKQGYTALEMLSQGDLGGYNIMLQDLSNRINLNNVNEDNSTAC